MADPAKRPLMIPFNGGPGSSSLWLHLGALGPKRVRMNDDGTMPAAPYALVDNERTRLDQSDLVFVDPVGTGYSRAGKAGTGPAVLGVEGDIQSVGEFIRLYLTRCRSPGPRHRAPEPCDTPLITGAGHMIDIDVKELIALRRDVAAFIATAVGHRARD